MDLLRDQAGIIARRQALLGGLTSNDVRRLLRRREWVVVHPGVYVDHTGPLTWLQRAWAGVLYAWPAALCGESALRAVEGPGRRKEAGPIQVAVAIGRQVADRPELTVRRMARLEDRALWNLGPPRLRFEDAVLDVALAAPTDFAAVGVVADACGGWRTTAARLQRAFAVRERSPRRLLLTSVLADVAEGACSVLEHGYLVRVERAHGLPRGCRQARSTATIGVIYRDVTYDDFDLELDGHLYHDSVEQRDRDLDRDLDSAAASRMTVRLGYGQVFDRPCRTAGRVATMLKAHGWLGTPVPCGPDCPLGVAEVSLADTKAPPNGQPAA